MSIAEFSRDDPFSERGLVQVTSGRSERALAVARADSVYGKIPPLTRVSGNDLRKSSRGRSTNWESVVLDAVLNAQQPQDLDEVSTILYFLGVERMQGQLETMQGTRMVVRGRFEGWMGRMPFG